MPASVRDLLDATGLTHHGVVRWTETIPGPSASLPGTGVYIVALTDDPDDGTAVMPELPVSSNRVDELLALRPELTVDGKRPSPAVLIERLSRYWFSDETVVYIGLAGPRAKPVKPSPLSYRVQEYRKTKLGARGPHAGGWPVKVLDNLDELWVHYSYVADYSTAEHELLGAFRAATSPVVRETWATNDVMPYANLEFPKGVRKAHGIGGAKQPRGTRVKAPKSPSGPPTIETPAPRPTSTATSDAQTRPVSAPDHAAGRIRLGRGNKDALPDTCQTVIVRLAGRELSARWDPRFGPPERSGVLSFGTATLREVADVGDAFSVIVGLGSVVELS